MFLYRQRRPELHLSPAVDSCVVCTGVQLLSNSGCKCGGTAGTSITGRGAGMR